MVLLYNVLTHDMYVLTLRQQTANLQNETTIKLTDFERELTCVMVEMLCIRRNLGILVRTLNHSEILYYNGIVWIKKFYQKYFITKNSLIMQL